MTPDDLILRNLEERTFPGIAARVEIRGETVFETVRGRASEFPDIRPLEKDALFDLASLTKSLATTTVLLHILEQEGLSTTRTAGEFLPGLHKEAAGISLHHLLLHTAGLPALPEIFRQFSDGNSCSRDRAVSHLIGLRPERQPGRLVVYSCTGYILLGLIAETLGGASLGTLFRKILCEESGLEDLFFAPAQNQRTRCATTEYDPWRGRWLRGEVHDENAWTLKGISGNAGLFGTLASVSELCSLFMTGGILKGKKILSGESLRSMTDNQTGVVPGENRSYGFACNGPGIFAGPGFSPQSFGHTGFTGTSVWMDPEGELKIVILTNRVHYGREHTIEKIKQFRRDFHRLFL